MEVIEYRNGRIVIGIGYIVASTAGEAMDTAEAIVRKHPEYDGLRLEARSAGEHVINYQPRWFVSLTYHRA